MINEWKLVPGYPEYCISKDGCVKRIVGGAGKVAGRILKPQKTPKGYLYVVLSRNGEPKAFRLNRLVLLAFVGEPLPGMEASHLDGNRLNNDLSNLKWESTKDNNARRKIHMTSAGDRNGRSKLNPAAVKEIRDRYAAGGETYTKLASEFGVSFGAIGHIVSRRQWNHVGGGAA